MERYISVGWLIDGTGGPVRKNLLLKIKDGKWIDLNVTDSGKGTDARVVTDLSHCTIIPPLIDSMVYLSRSAAGYGQGMKGEPDNYETALAEILRHRDDHFSHGVLALRNGLERKGYVARYVAESAGELHPICLQVTGNGWIGVFSGVGKWTGQQDHKGVIDCCVLSDTTLRERIHRVYSEGGRLLSFVSGGHNLRRLVSAGCRNIDCARDITRDDLRYMADHGVGWTPQLSALEQGIGLFGESLDQLKYLQLVSMARDYGVPVTVGTGSGLNGVLHGESMVNELKLFMKAGYSLRDAIRCSVENGARLLGIESDFGPIEVGKPATFLVARGTPAQLPRKLAYLEGIYLNGEPCPRDLYCKI